MGRKSKAQLKADKLNEDGDKVGQIRRAVDNYWHTTQTFRMAMQDDLRCVVGGEGMWHSYDADKLKSENRPVTSFNILFGLVNFLSGYEIERAQDYRYFPRGVEDEAIGRYATTLAKYAMDRTDGRDVLSAVFRQGSIGGLGVVDVSRTFDRSDDLVEGDILLDRVDPLGWTCDPYARRYDRNDGQHMTKLFWMPFRDAQKRWPEIASEIDPIRMSDLMLNDPYTTTAEHLDEKPLYWDQKTGQVRILQHWYRVPVTATVVVNKAAPPGTEPVMRMDSEKDAEDYLKSIRDQGGAAMASQYQIQNVDSAVGLVGPTGVQQFHNADAAEQMLMMIREQAGARAAQAYEIISRPTTALRVAHLTGWNLLQDEAPESTGDWRFPMATFIPYQDIDDYSSMKGIVRDIKDPNREINWVYAMLMDRMVRGPKDPIFFSKSENADLAKYKSEIHRAGFLGEFNTTPPVILSTQLAIQNELALIGQGISIILQISGLNAELMGQTTQKTVSGRAIEKRQAGGLVGIGTLMSRWMATKRYVGELLIRNIQRNYSPEKMLRIIGEERRLQEMNPMMQQMGMKPASTVVPVEQTLAALKQVKDIEFDVVTDFQESTPTARQAVFSQLLQLMAVGIPVPPNIILDSSDVPYKEEIKHALKTQGMGAPNPDLAKVLGAGQGQAGSQPMGVNKG